MKRFASEIALREAQCKKRMTPARGAMQEMHEAEVQANDPWPSEIRREDDGRRLVVVFEDGASFPLSAEHLRVRSPSAEVRGHSEAQRKTVGGKRNVRILAVTPVGNYAVRLEFDDGHSTGIYTWRALRALGASAEEDFALYLEELAAKGLDRDRPAEA